MKRRDHLLWILSEECDEVGQRASKAARFGSCEVQPGQPLSNAERLIGEWIDACAAVEMLVDDGHLTLPDEQSIRVAIEAKKAKVERFLAYSRVCGTLDEDVEPAGQCLEHRQDPQAKGTGP